jgi:predicted RNA-binding protein Jag
MGIDADILAAEVEDGVRFSIQSKTKGLLIGRRGETLDAMQYLTSLVVNRSRKQERNTCASRWIPRITATSAGYAHTPRPQAGRKGQVHRPPLAMEP